MKLDKAQRREAARHRRRYGMRTFNKGIRIVHLVRPVASARVPETSGTGDVRHPYRTQGHDAHRQENQ